MTSTTTECCEVWAYGCTADSSCRGNAVTVNGSESRRSADLVPGRVGHRGAGVRDQLLDEMPTPRRHARDLLAEASARTLPGSHVSAAVPDQQGIQRAERSSFAGRASARQPEGPAETDPGRGGCARRLGCHRGAGLAGVGVTAVEDLAGEGGTSAADGHAGAVDEPTGGSRCPTAEGAAVLVRGGGVSTSGPAGSG